MSEFFKALEQAERDRLREEAESAGTPLAPRGAPVESAKAAAEPKVVQPPARTPSEPMVAETKPVETPVETRTAAPRPVIATPKAVSSSPPPAGAQAPVPVSVFRPALRTLQPPSVTRRIGSGQSALIAQTDPGSIEAEAYRTVRTNIELMSDNGAFRHIAITSAAGGDGKSTTAANLAVVAAQGGRRVCLVDADFRRPALHDIFGLPNTDGLASALEHGKPLGVVARPVDVDNLSVVVAGRGAAETFVDLLTPQRLDNVLRESTSTFDLVVFDTPPVVLADALNVAAACDGVILVVRAGSIPFSVLRRAIGQVKQVKGRVLGVLLNQADLRAAGDSYRYYRAYHTSDARL